MELRSPNNGSLLPYITFGILLPFLIYARTKEETI